MKKPSKRRGNSCRPQAETAQQRLQHVGADQTINDASDGRRPRRRSTAGRAPPVRWWPRRQGCGYGRSIAVEEERNNEAQQQLEQRVREPGAEPGQGVPQRGHIPRQIGSCAGLHELAPTRAQPLSDDREADDPFGRSGQSMLEPAPDRCGGRTPTSSAMLQPSAANGVTRTPAMSAIISAAASVVRPPSLSRNHAHSGQVE